MAPAMTVEANRPERFTLIKTPNFIVCQFVPIGSHRGSVIDGEWAIFRPQCRNANTIATNFVAFMSQLSF
ncbi:hypothetical protein [Brevundimonas sp. RM1]